MRALYRLPCAVAMFNQLGIENPILYFSSNALSATKEHRRKAKKVTRSPLANTGCVNNRPPGGEAQV
jgi:hypothetical protein